MQSAAGIQQIAGTAEDLRNLTNNLETLVRKFRLDKIDTTEKTSRLEVRANGKLVQK